MGKPIWERTSVQNLLRNASSGRYYARWTIGGKQKWVNLKTHVFTVAKLRLGDQAKHVAALRNVATAVSAGSATVGELMAVYEQRTRTNPDLKPASITARLVALKKLQKTWPDLARLKPAAVTPAAVADWAARFKATGTRFRPPGAKTTLPGNSATSVNRAIDTLRQVLDLAVERGAIHINPARAQPLEGRLKKKLTPKKLVLPTMEEVQRLFVAMENNGARGGWGAEAADFCRFLSFTGCRVNEVAAVTWADVDSKKMLLRIRGGKSQSSDRIIPLFSELNALLLKIRERRKHAAAFGEGVALLQATNPLFRLRECQKTITNACQAIGIARLTHHDFRHLFATRCIESGVDIPTVSRWLGHADGGALAMRTYGHLRLDHSLAQAAKVNFTGFSFAPGPMSVS